MADATDPAKKVANIEQAKSIMSVYSRLFELAAVADVTSWNIDLDNTKLYIKDLHVTWEKLKDRFAELSKTIEPIIATNKVRYWNLGAFTFV